MNFALWIVAGLAALAFWLWFRARLHREECAAGRHALVRQTEEAYRWPAEDYYGVADETVEVRQKCRHCPEATEWSVVDRTKLTGLSMPSARWRQLRKTGRISS